MRNDALIQLAVFTSRPEFHLILRDHLTSIRSNGVASWRECYECVLQCYLFAGFPAALEAARVLHQVWHDEEALPTEADMLEAFKLYHQNLENGESLYRQVYAAKAPHVREGLMKLSPELALWAVTEGYGKTLSRPGLDVVTRELAIVAMLTQLGWDRQLFSHIIGAQNVGATPEEISNAIRIGALVDHAKSTKAHALLERVPTL